MSTTGEPRDIWQLPRLDEVDSYVPPGIDVTRPHPARMYNYYLGGKDNFAADREAAEQVIAAAPSARPSARGNRLFLRRAVRYLARRGVRQFLDVGTGIPTVGNTHEAAQELAPDARVVYADNDPIVLVHARALLRGTPEGRTSYVEADVRKPGTILAHPQVRGVIDFGKPVAVLLVALLHFVRDEEDPAALVAELRDALVPGSYLVLTHTSADFDAERARGGAQIYNRATAPAVLRERAEILHLFDGFDLVEPGLVPLPEWDPDDDPYDGAYGEYDESLVWLYGGVGRKN
ncbi:SAM-dependent methyltransferase [Yinghuangia seranimata]|uniref:SAM-dependent methyltransferase n=1 Tax=Yinghuangia seranimata TaxID=408067 RepID=UPI00248CCD4F|nr:SAM-dependent methyltransferase [Yinghuangia seranimata]MDI2127838.1 SAM-dependent methyltransferase [Yinghuangia seranimata]